MAQPQEMGQVKRNVGGVDPSLLVGYRTELPLVNSEANGKQVEGTTEGH